MRRGAAGLIVVWFWALGAGACDASLTSVGAWSGDSSSLQGGDAAAAFYLEAEMGQLSGGFTLESDPGVSGGAYVAPPAAASSDAVPGPARVVLPFDAPVAGTYYVWGRIHSPDATHNRFWLQIDGGAWTLWRISTGEVWWWNPAHDDAAYAPAMQFALSAGPHQIVIADAAGGLGIDRFYLTTGTETPPGNDGPCEPPHTIQIAGVCLPSCGSQGGNSCGTVQCAGYPILPAYDCDVCCVIPNDP
jgi:hypothetical protein